ncbi:Carbonic anhydrase [compost metagenome]
MLQVKRIVVMGHAYCGGVNAMLNGSPANCQDFVAPWVEQAAPTVRRLVEDFPADQVERVAEETVVRLSIDNLRTFPWIAAREAAGDLVLSGLHFGIADGILSKLTSAKRFERLG